jgi:hypothetical protein
VLAADPAARQKFLDQARRYETEKEGIRKEAEVRAEVEGFQRAREHALHPHERSRSR